VFAQYPIEVAHGEGVWLYARDGRKILDFYGGHAVAGLGYGHPRWLAALERQARQMAFQTNALPMAIRERAAARLSNSRASDWTPCFGSTAAPRPTRTRSNSRSRPRAAARAVALEQGWHGRTAAAGAVTWGALEKWYGFPRTPFDVSFTPRDDPARSTEPSIATPPP
jgi:acetylornithine/N-succinyldiaminopimelate aminotransferase